MAVSPGNADPSKTATLQRRFGEEIRRRVITLQREIVQLVVQDDAFGLSPKHRTLHGKTFSINEEQVHNINWRFKTTNEQLSLFQQWLGSKFGGIVDEQKAIEEDRYWHKYVMDGYTKGAGRAFDETNKLSAAKSEGLDFYKGTKYQFLKSSFGQPETVAKVKLLAGRVLTELKGVTEKIAGKLSRVLTDGLVQGQNPKTIAQTMVKELGMTGKQAETIARTEIIRAHAEGAIDAYEALGVTKLGVMVEWDTAGDGRVCPLCATLQGIVLTTKEAHGMFPRHPNCRCTPIPAQVGEDDDEQIKGKKNIQEAIDQSLALDKSKIPTWGPGSNLAPKRPKGIIDAKTLGGTSTPPIPTTVGPPTTAVSPPIASPLPVSPPSLPAPARAPRPVKKKPPKPKPKPKFTPEGLPTRESVVVETTLPGSTNPKLVIDAKGNKWVMKEGLNPGHVSSEVTADDLYRIIGADVPKSGIVNPEAPIKFSEYIPDGKTLNHYLKTATPEQAAAIKAQIQQHFVADALLGNWDVIGLGMDNILVKGGKAVRIDNGGALFYRAQGKLKTNWGREVTELVSLRNPNVNAQTANIFKGITDKDIIKQINALNKKSDKILAAVAHDPKLQEVLKERLDWLAKHAVDLKDEAKQIAKAAKEAQQALKKQLAAAKKIEERAAKQAAKAAAQAEKARLQEQAAALRQSRKGAEKSAQRQATRAKGQVTDELVKEVEESGINGRFLHTDKDAIEDVGVLIWEEVDENGEQITKLWGKLTPKGVEDIEKVTGKLPTLSWDGTRTDDIYWAAIDKGLQDAESGFHNRMVVRTLEAFQKDIQAELSLSYLKGAGNIDTSRVAMLEQYNKACKAVLNHDFTTKKRFVHGFTQYVDDVGALPVTPKGPYQFTEVDSKVRTLDIAKGKVKGRNTKGKYNYAGGKNFQVDIDGTTFTIRPRQKTTGGARGKALFNSFEVTVKGKPSKETINKGLEAIQRLGINTAAPTTDYLELTYLQKSVRAAGKDVMLDYKRIVSMEASDSVKVEKLKDWVSKELLNGKRVDDIASYDPFGKAIVGNNQGNNYWLRVDLTPDVIEKEMSEYMIYHSTSKELEEVLANVLDSGGQMTSTVQRVRKGIPIADTGGMSSSMDMETGGADYLFTRIYPKRAELNQSGLIFDIKTLSRTDAISYHGDFYGNVDYVMGRARTIEELKNNSLSSSNETMFKHGLSVLDDLTSIVVSTEAQAKKVRKVFESRNITHIKGTPIEKIIKLVKR